LTAVETVLLTAPSVAGNANLRPYENTAAAARLTIRYRKIVNAKHWSAGPGSMMENAGHTSCEALPEVDAEDAPVSPSPLLVDGIVP
jgi:hypothetical protein